MASPNENYTFPSVQIPASNGITFTAKRWGQFPTITFVNGAVAGSEVATVDSNLNISVTIQSGTTTQTQVIAAINKTATPDNAALTPASLVSCATTHGSSAVVSFVGVGFTGGLAAASKANLVNQGLLLTAVTAGTSGNSIRLKLTSGATAGSEIVTVSTDDISVQIADATPGDYTPFEYETPGVDFTTLEQLVAAINADTDASALVVASIVPSTSVQQGIFVAPLASYTNLAGGAAAAVASTGAFQGLTTVTVADGPTLKTLTLTDGATAGSEVVTVSSGNVSIQCQIGTSTVTQIRTAAEASTPFTTLYTMTGTASTTPVSVYRVALSGAASQPGMGFYTDNTSTTLTTSYQYLAFDDVMSSVDIQNTDASGNNVLSFSWDGINVHGLLAATQERTFRPVNYSGIFVKYVTGSPAFKIFAVKAR